MIELMSRYVSSPNWMGVLVFVSLIVLLISVPLMYSKDESKSDKISYFVLITTVIFTGFMFYGAAQQQAGLREKNFIATRSGDTLYVTSGTPWLQSKKFPIRSENDNHIYIQDGPNPKETRIYEIDKNELE